MYKYFPRELILPRRVSATCDRPDPNRKADIFADFTQRYTIRKSNLASVIRDETPVYSGF